MNLLTLSQGLRSTSLAFTYKKSMRVNIWLAKIVTFRVRPYHCLWFRYNKRLTTSRSTTCPRRCTKKHGFRHGINRPEFVNLTTFILWCCHLVLIRTNSISLIHFLLRTYQTLIDFVQWNWILSITHSHLTPCPICQYLAVDLAISISVIVNDYVCQVHKKKMCQYSI